jgi:hypothetical protein
VQVCSNAIKRAEWPAIFADLEAAAGTAAIAKNKAEEKAANQAKQKAASEKKKAKEDK